MVQSEVTLLSFQGSWLALLRHDSLNRGHWRWAASAWIDIKVSLLAYYYYYYPIINATADLIHAHRSSGPSTR